MNECFCVYACVSMLTTYIHFTLVNHIEVVAFITWREEKQRNTGVCERAEKKQEKSVEPTGKPTVPITTTSCLSSQRWIFKPLNQNGCIRRLNSFVKHMEYHFLWAWGEQKWVKRISLSWNLHIHSYIHRHTFSQLPFLRRTTDSLSCYHFVLLGL